MLRNFNPEIKNTESSSEDIINPDQPNSGALKPSCSSMSRQGCSRLLGGLLVLCLCVYFLTYITQAHGPYPIRADGAGYYSYLTAALIHRDLTFHALAKQQYGGEMPAWSHVRLQAETGRYLPVYNMGVSVLALPFFTAGHGLTWMFRSPTDSDHAIRLHYPLDGYSPFYQHMMGLAGLFYFIFGLVLLRNHLLRYFDPMIVAITMLAMIFGTNLFFYATGDTVNTHAYTFFASSMLIWAVDRWYRHPASITNALLLGLAAGLLVLIRTLNIFYLILPVVYGVHHWTDIPGHIRFLWKHGRSVAVICVVALLCFIPQLLMWKYATGALFVNAYGDSAAFGDAHVGAVLFSVKKGMLVWFPITAMALAGFLFMRRYAASLFPGILLFTGLFLFTISKYFIWYGGGGFGNRYLVDLSGWLMFPLASFFAYFRPVAYSRRVIGACAVGCVLWTLFLWKLYNSRELSYFGLDHQALYDLIWWRMRAVVEWWKGF